MPQDEFNDRAVARKPGQEARQNLRSQAANGLHALLTDVMYFRWAFAGLVAVIWMATVC